MSNELVSIQKNIDVLTNNIQKYEYLNRPTTNMNNKK